jgi:N-carbamoylputrescine amidase
MRIALVQCRASRDDEANRRAGAAAVEAAAKKRADLVCFPELAFTRFLPQRRAPKDVSRLAETVPGPTTDFFAALARRHKIVLVLNLFERSGRRCFDSSPVIDADGRLLGRTRMVHITDYPRFHERGYYAPGDTGAPVYETAAGRVGVAICYDRHFPEYLRALALAGAELIVVPQAGTVGEWPDGLYEAEMQTAAFQNGLFTALCNRCGTEEKMRFSGESFVCAPDGRVVARAGRGPALLTADLDLRECASSHARRLFFKHRRPEVYHPLVKPPP